jgi:cytochrome-b5 reductase
MATFSHESPLTRGSTPLYQLLNHALKSPSNKTKFTLLFSNVTEKDILLREEFDALKAQHADKLNVVYVLDQPSKTWNGPSLTHQ